MTDQKSDELIELLEKFNAAFDVILEIYVEQATNFKNILVKAIDDYIEQNAEDD